MSRLLWICRKSLPKIRSTIHVLFPGRAVLWFSGRWIKAGAIGPPGLPESPLMWVPGNRPKRCNHRWGPGDNSGQGLHRRAVHGRPPNCSLPPGCRMPWPPGSLWESLPPRTDSKIPRIHECVRHSLFRTIRLRPATQIGFPKSGLRADKILFKSCTWVALRAMNAICGRLVLTST